MKANGFVWVLTGVLLLCLCIAVVPVSAAAPVAQFSGYPLSGPAPLNVAFTDSSTGTPTGWAWFFGDENYTAPWTLVNASAGWGGGDHSSVVMPDGSIVLMNSGGGVYNDTWRSTNNGTTWTRMNASCGWRNGRHGASSVALPDGSIILMGGYDGNFQYNDTWRSTNNGTTWTLINASSGWTVRTDHRSVVMSDGSIVLMGGYGAGGITTNDVWRSTDRGDTWTLMNASAGWSPRHLHSSVALPDGSIVLMGGYLYLNDTWRSVNNGSTWTQVNASSGWTGRSSHTSVAMPDGSIVLLGGHDSSNYRNDTWRSTDKGVTWTQVNSSAAWTARYWQSTVAMPDGSIVLMGGLGLSDPYTKNDVWRFMPVGSSAQTPSHTYTIPGSYQVALQALNNVGYNSTTIKNYITVNNPGSTTSIALVVGEGTVTPREDAVYSLLKARGYEIDNITKDQATINTLKGYKTVVFVENYALESNLVNELLTDGNNVLLLGDAPQMLSGLWTSGASQYLNVLNNAAYLSDYANLSPIPMDTSGSHYMFYGTDLPDWTGIGTDGNSYGYTTALYYTGTGSGRGTILSYDPESYADGEAQVILDKALSYTTGTPLQAPEPVGSGEVAFILGSYTSTTLTSREQAVYNRFVNKGYSVHLVTAYNRTMTDYNQSAFVVQVEPLGFQHKDFYTGLLETGNSVLLLGDAPQMLSRFWVSGASQYLIVLNNAAYLSDYASLSTIPMETSGSHYMFYGTDLPDWTGIGTDGNSYGYTTALYYTGTGSGRGAVLSYDPESYAADGEHIFYSSVGYVKTGELPTNLPVASFTANVTSGAAPLAVQFNDTSSGSPTEWNWTFGDGTYSTTQNPAHTFTVSESYTISLNATNSGGSNVSVRTNYIVVTGPKPIANFTATSPTSGITPLTVSFNDLSLNSPTGWAWFFGDENYTVPWTQQTASTGWTGRYYHSSVVMPDGSIVLMGGFNGSVYYNDVWRSEDNGASWTQQTPVADWSVRNGHTSVVMPDGSIVLMGGNEGNTYYHDVWRSVDYGKTWTETNSSADWSARSAHSSVVMPDNSILIMGGSGNGNDPNGNKNDVWRSTDYGKTWTETNSSAGWVARYHYSSVVLPDGSIVLMGGYGPYWIVRNDVWRSTDYGKTWTEINSSAGWAARAGLSSIVMPDGSIVLMGGNDGSGSAKNDVWRSSDKGATWTKITESAEWLARVHQRSVVMPDGSIVLMGGYDGSSHKNDVWRFNPVGSSAQNPSHTYTTPGSYQIALQAYNDGGYNSTRVAGYITVTGLSGPVVNGTIINQYATIYIGEQGLNVTHALNQAQSSPIDGMPPLTNISWWASGTPSGLPAKTIDLNGNYTSLNVTPADFIGLFGNWYVADSSGQAVATEPAFIVADPALDIRVWDFQHAADVTGTSVPLGTRLGFRIDTNMYEAVNETFRSPINPATDGFINIKVRNESSATLIALFNDSTSAGPLAGPNTILANFVNFTPYYWGSPGTYSWKTDAMNNSEYVYPADTYTVWAESTLNHMKENYQNGGSDYTGKTVSPIYTITLIPETVAIEINKDSVVRTKPFSVTITGLPSTTYHVWVNSSSSMTGGYDDQPPIITPYQSGVQFDTFEPAAPYNVNPDAQNGGYTFQNSGGKTIWEDVAHGTCTGSACGTVDYRGALGNGTYLYANVSTSSSGTRTFEFTTTNWTKAQNYTIRVEKFDGEYTTDQIDVKVEKGAPTVAAFSGTPTSGLAPLPVTFTDESIGDPTGWVWFFGDENYTAPWTQQAAIAGWTGRYSHSSVAMPDGSIVLMGGFGPGWTRINDVWRSTNNGAAWTQMTPAAEWSGRAAHSSVVLPDGSIVLMGGEVGWGAYGNDVWLSTNNGATWTLMNASAGWAPRYEHSSVVMPDGSIILMGGRDSTAYYNDVWRSEDNGATWMQMTAGAGWTPRGTHSSVVMPDGSIVLMGGDDGGSSYKNDTWRSTDNGTTWSLLTASAGWIGRGDPASIVMPDGSIVLMGGHDGSIARNDVWRSTDNGATWTRISANAGWAGKSGHSSVAMPDGSIILMGGTSNGADPGGNHNDVWLLNPAGSTEQNPSHTYTEPRAYSVALQSYNAGGYNSTRIASYITVTGGTPSLTVTGITPAYGIRTGPVSITNLAGTGFAMSGATVNLTKSGEMNISATNIGYISSKRLTCDFDLTGAATGTWDVVVTSPDGQSGTLTNGFTVTAHNVDFTWDASSGISNVNFTDISTPTPQSWYWEFGDGDNSTLQNPQHPYSTAGTYTVSLNATYSDGSDKATKQIAVMQKTQAAAQQAVVNNLPPTFTSDQSVDFSQNPLLPDTYADQWGGKPPISLPGESGYLGVYDSCPRCNGDHEYTYYYVNESGTIIQTVTAETPPTNIDVSQVYGNVTDPGSDLNSVTSPSANPGGGLGPLNLYGVCSGSDCRNNYALLISGGYTASDNHIRYFNDISFMYQTLNQTYGYPKDHITVLMADGNNPAADRHNATTASGIVLTDSSPADLDSDGVAELTATSSATKSNLITTLNALNTKLTPADSLFIFTTSHGGNDTPQGVNKSILYLWNKEYINDTEFVGRLPATPGNITMVMEQCNSGGFVDNFTIQYTGSQKRVIATAAKGDEPSHGNGFSNAWTKGVAMINDQRTPAREADNAPYGNTDGKISMSEAFKYANATDPSANSTLSQHEHPQYSTKNLQDTGVTKYLFSNTCTGPLSIRVGTPNTAETWYMGYKRNITWTQTGLTGNVDIELWNSTKARTITTTVPASQGFYTWTIPRDLKASTLPDYKIKIFGNTTRTVNDTSDAAFSIKTNGAPGTLKVNSSPRGAQIYLDGYPKTGTSATTNTTFSADPGSHTVTVKLDGYIDQSSGILLSPSQSYPVLTFILESLGSGNSLDYGTIYVTSDPWEAEILIGGVSTGRTTTAEIPVLPGTYSVTVQGYGYALTDPQVVTVNKGEIINADFRDFTLGPNVPPLVDAGADATLDEGTFESSGFFRDAGDGPWTANVSYGDGTGIQTLILNADKTFVLSHMYTANGIFTVTVEVSDGSLTGTDTATVTVNNVNQPPVLATIGAQSVSEGVKLEFAISATDPDGNPLTNTTSTLPGGAVFVAGTGTFTWTPGYDQAGSYPVTFTVSDGTASDSEVVTITVTNANQPPVLATIGTKSVNDGVKLEFAVSAADADNDQLTYSATPLPTGATFDPVTRTFSWTPALAQVQPTPYSLNFSVTDGPATDSEIVAITVTHTNAAPTFTSISPISGSTLGGTTVTITGTNLNGANAVTFGGTAATGVSVISPTQITATTPTHAAGTVSVSVTTLSGTATKTGAYTYGTNTAPVLGEIVVPLAPVKTNTRIDVNAPLTPPNNVNTFTANWTWNDGTFTQMNLPAGTTKVISNHTYKSAGVYTVSLKVTDKATGLSASKNSLTYVIVYDPTAGYVVGAGTIASPAGAYLPNPLLNGTGYFGFESKYQKGISKPQGITAFYYDLGTMRFFSNNYDWLVVTGSKASFKGSGTINGKGNYGFLLTATDGALTGRTTPDKFRIRIWNKTPFKRVYDNMLDAPDDADPTTVIKNGFIIIQK